MARCRSSQAGNLRLDPWCPVDGILETLSETFALSPLGFGLIITSLASAVLASASLPDSESRGCADVDLDGTVGFTIKCRTFDTSYPPNDGIPIYGQSAVCHAFNEISVLNRYRTYCGMV
jgi:hypothetical protein